MKKCSAGLVKIVMCEHFDLLAVHFVKIDVKHKYASVYVCLLKKEFSSSVKVFEG